MVAVLCLLLPVLNLITVCGQGHLSIPSSIREFPAPYTKNPNSFAPMYKGSCTVSQDKISPCPGCALDSLLGNDVLVLIIKYARTPIKVTSQSSSC